MTNTTTTNERAEFLFNVLTEEFATQTSLKWANTFIKEIVSALSAEQQVEVFTHICNSWNIDPDWDMDS